MAAQKATFLTGRMDNVIFYQRDGKFFARSMPVKVKQTKATKQRSRNFAVAASAGRVLRGSLSPTLLFPKDKKMQSRFSGAIAKWLKQTDVKNLQPENSIPEIEGFDFNERTGISERLKVGITVSQQAGGKFTVDVPAFIPTKKITAPAGTVKVVCSITIAACKLKSLLADGSSTHDIEIPYDGKTFGSQTVQCPIGTAKGSLVVTVVSLRYMGARNIPNKNQSFMPCSVVDARFC